MPKYGTSLVEVGTNSTNTSKRVTKPENMLMPNIIFDGDSGGNQNTVMVKKANRTHGKISI